MLIHYCILSIGKHESLSSCHTLTMIVVKMWIHGLVIRTCFFLPSARSDLRGQRYNVIQGARHRRRRRLAFSVRVVKWWNKLRVSVVKAPSVNVFKKRLEKAWTDWLDTHLSISLLPPNTTCTPPINSYHLYMLPNSPLYICGSFRPVVDYFLPL